MEFNYRRKQFLLKYIFRIHQIKNHLLHKILPKLPTDEYKTRQTITRPALVRGMETLKNLNLPIVLAWPDKLVPEGLNQKIVKFRESEFVINEFVWKAWQVTWEKSKTFLNIIQPTVPQKYCT